MIMQLESLLERLTRHEVRFVVVGGVAALAQGCTLVTRDLDVCVELGTENLLRLQEALKDLNPRHRISVPSSPLLLTAAQANEFRNLYLKTDWGVLDALGEVLGLGNYAEVLSWSEEVEVAGSLIRILSLEGIIRAKQAMNRPKDRQAVRELEAIRALRQSGSQ